MKLAEFVEQNFDFINVSGSIGSAGMIGHKLAKFKRILLKLDEFKGVQTLNILSMPFFRTYYNNSPRPQYIANSEEDRSVITEKHFDETKFKVDYRVEYNIGAMAELKTIADTELIQCVTAAMMSGVMLSDTVDLYAINVAGYSMKEEELRDLGEGIYFLPTTYNQNTFEPCREIRIKINPDRAQDRHMATGESSDEIIDNISNFIKEKINTTQSYTNVPLHYSIMLRVSPRSIRRDVRNIHMGEKITVKIHKKENDDIINNIFGRQPDAPRFVPDFNI